MPDPPDSAAENMQAQQHIAVVNQQLNILPFTISNDANDTAVRWAKWKKDIERQFRFFRPTDPEVKKDSLIIYGGPQIADSEDSLPDLLLKQGTDILFTIHLEARQALSTEEKQRLCQI